MALHFVALGANSPDGRAANLRRVWRAARALPGRRVALSAPWRSPAWPPGRGQPDFVNAVAATWSPMPPEAMLARLHTLEAAAGRVRGARWSMRVLDLDLLAVGRLVRPDRRTLMEWLRLPPAAQGERAPAALILPHPRLADRAFVLAPLAQVAPGWRHPVTGLGPAAMLALRPGAERRAVRALAGWRGVVKGPRRA